MRRGGCESCGMERLRGMSGRVVLVGCAGRGRRRARAADRRVSSADLLQGKCRPWRRLSARGECARWTTHAVWAGSLLRWFARQASACGIARKCCRPIEGSRPSVWGRLRAWRLSSVRAGERGRALTVSLSSPCARQGWRWQAASKWNAVRDVSDGVSVSVKRD